MPFRLAGARTLSHECNQQIGRGGVGSDYLFKPVDIHRSESKGSPVARQLRIEYPGAVYHVMNRGDRREAISVE